MDPFFIKKNWVLRIKNIKISQNLVIAKRKEKAGVVEPEKYIVRMSPNPKNLYLSSTPSCSTNLSPKTMFTLSTKCLKSKPYIFANSFYPK